MAQRALRKLRQQKELEEQQLIAASQSVKDEDEESEEDFEQISKPRNVFDMLDGANDDEDDEDVDDAEEEEVTHSIPSTQTTQPSTSTPSSIRPGKKQKKKQKKKNKANIETPKQGASEDEIDKALKELNVKNTDISGHESDIQWELSATKILAIEPKNLDPVNEMRGLFGNIALEDESRARPQPARRRDQNQQGGVDLGTALTAPYNHASRGKALGALAKRRNCFTQGREDWPLATSGGLSMELAESATFEKRYNIMHNDTYKQAQWEFRLAVESMQAEQMIRLLSYFPYHIASLLQVSEIAKHQGDSLVSGDLLERALFSFGRSVHSSFPAAMRSGVARLSFNKPANRELYLTIWRYIRNLEQRGTWKTAFEWSKLLLQLNTTSDPFGVTLMIDQMALRGRQHEQFLELVSDSAYGRPWSHLPNIQISKCLALLRAKKPKEARQQLALAMHHYPYILSALASALDVTPIPKSIWGKLPSTDAEKLYTELYVTRAKDLWNTPETIGLISEVANTQQYYKSFIDSHVEPSKLEISLEEARHIMLLEIPALIALLPRHFTTMPTSSSDVLPPPDSEQSEMTLRPPTSTSATGLLQNLFNDAAGPLALPGNMIQRALQMFMRPANPSPAQNGAGEGNAQGAIAELRQQLGPAAEGLNDQQLEHILASHLIDDDELVEAVFGGHMPGGWDYEEDAAGEDDLSSVNSSMPDLIDDTENPQPAVQATATSQPEPTSRGPHTATVEEADSDSDNDDRLVQAPTSSRSILRHIDSDEEEQEQQHWPTTPVRQPAPRPQPAAQTHSAIETPPAPTSEDIESNPQRLQRWLITSGLDDIKNGGNTSLYVKRLKMLHRNQQGWILSVVKQRGDADLAARIEAAL